MKLSLDLDQHSAIDYVFVATTLGLPYALGFAHSERAKKTLRRIILASAAKDLMTRYRYSVAKVIPIGVHLTMDLVVGAAIAASPDPRQLELPVSDN